MTPAPSPLPLFTLPNPATGAPRCLCSQAISGPTTTCARPDCSDKRARRRATLQTKHSPREAPKSADHTRDPQRSPTQLGRARLAPTAQAASAIPTAAG